MNLRTITLFAVALTLYLVGSTALELISSLLPIPIPIECVLIGLFMGMFPRKTAMVFYAVTCGILIIETLASIPNLVITIQSIQNFGLALETNPVDAPIINSLWLEIIVLVLSIMVLVKYKMEAVKAFLNVMFKLILFTIYIVAPMFIFIIIIFGLKPVGGVLNTSPVLIACTLVLWDIYITVTGPLVARWVFRRIGVYRRIPKIWQG